jgi:hypothetical protein
MIALHIKCNITICNSSLLIAKDYFILGMQKITLTTVAYL